MTHGSAAPTPIEMAAPLMDETVKSPGGGDETLIRVVDLPTTSSAEPSRDRSLQLGVRKIKRASGRRPRMEREIAEWRDFIIPLQSKRHTKTHELTRVGEGSTALRNGRSFERSRTRMCASNRSFVHVNSLCPSRALGEVALWTRLKQERALARRRSRTRTRANADHSNLRAISPGSRSSGLKVRKQMPPKGLKMASWTQKQSALYVY